MNDNVERNIAKRNQRFKDLEELIVATEQKYSFPYKEKIDDYVKAIYEEVDYTKDPSEAGWPPKLESGDLIKHFIHQTQK
tara:strand:+ start:254 stop:493 length:240 start_codon:yes stop_codon:yes gene_type:complete